MREAGLQFLHVMSDTTWASERAGLRIRVCVCVCVCVSGASIKGTRIHEYQAHGPLRGGSLLLM